MNLIKKKNIKVSKKIKKGDLIYVNAGDYRGTIDYISRYDPKKQLVYIKKAFRLDYPKKTKQSKNVKTGIIKEKSVKKLLPIALSNVSYWLEDKKKAVRVGFIIDENNVKLRKSHKYNTLLN